MKNVFHIFYGTETCVHVFWLPSSSFEQHLQHKEQVNKQLCFSCEKFNNSVAIRCAAATRVDMTNSFDLGHETRVAARESYDICVRLPPDVQDKLEVSPKQCATLQCEK